jgi:NAD(P)-dependent dehydrogenase (short-subunit alcohol dehydrogenase family)
MSKRAAQRGRRRTLEGRVALVTGASSGIGRAIALGFADAGADLILVARRAHRLVEVVHAAEAVGRRALLVVSDVAVDRAVRRVFHQAGLVFPRIDVLVNNAGMILPEQPVQSTLPADWDRLLAVNLRGPFLFSRLVAPMMVEAGYGRIINVTSSYKAQPGYGAYSVSKAALCALTRVMAQELRGTGVLVNALDPGWIRSEMSPDGGRPAERVIPLALRLAALPPSGPTGREFVAA